MTHFDDLWARLDKVGKLVLRDFKFPELLCDKDNQSTLTQADKDKIKDSVRSLSIIIEPLDVVMIKEKETYRFVLVNGKHRLAAWKELAEEWARIRKIKFPIKLPVSLLNEKKWSESSEQKRVAIKNSKNLIKDGDVFARSQDIRNLSLLEEYRGLNGEDLYRSLSKGLGYHKDTVKRGILVSQLPQELVNFLREQPYLRERDIYKIAQMYSKSMSQWSKEKNQQLNELVLIIKDAKNKRDEIASVVNEGIGFQDQIEKSKKLLIEYQNIRKRYELRVKELIGTLPAKIIECFDQGSVSPQHRSYIKEKLHGNKRKLKSFQKEIITSLKAFALQLQSNSNSRHAVQNRIHVQMSESKCKELYSLLTDSCIGFGVTEKDFSNAWLKVSANNALNKVIAE